MLLENEQDQYNNAEKILDSVLNFELVDNYMRQELLVRGHGGMKQQATKGCARSLDGDKIKQTSYSRGSMDVNDEVRPVYDITKAKQLLVP